LGWLTEVWHGLEDLAKLSDYTAAVSFA